MTNPLPISTGGIFSSSPLAFFASKPSPFSPTRPVSASEYKPPSLENIPPNVFASFFICTCSSFLIRACRVRASRCALSISRIARTSFFASSNSSNSTFACARRNRALSLWRSMSSALLDDSTVSFHAWSFSATAALFRYKLSLIFFVSRFSSSEKLWSCSTNRSAFSYFLDARIRLPALYASLPMTLVSSPNVTRSALVIVYTSFSLSKETRVMVRVTLPSFASAPNSPAHSRGTAACAVSPAFISITHSSTASHSASLPVMNVLSTGNSVSLPATAMETTQVAPSLGRSHPSPSTVVILVPRPSQIEVTLQCLLRVTTTSATCGGTVVLPAGTPSRYCTPPGTFRILYRTDSPSFIFFNTAPRPRKGASLTKNVEVVGATISSPAPATSESGAVTA
mmetsp:Transcript_5385/g.20215  ORF Transcript_5385/g.20215 Transcript_5385/m.20215 type:complete len:398 (+) Transcript_5385:4527-5720(+)